ncbi:MAG: YaiI/YqxD family protein [Pseudomonadota bacterium]
MKIYIDADACPNAAKEVLFKTSKRLNIELILVSNRSVRAPEGDHVKCIIVEKAADAADDKIVELLEAGDLVITSDILLAARIVKKSAFALNSHGQLFDDDNIGSRLAVRNLLEDLRNSGIQTSWSAPYNAKNKADFANALNRFITKRNIGSKK